MTQARLAALCYARVPVADAAAAAQFAEATLGLQRAGDVAGEIRWRSGPPAWSLALTAEAQQGLGLEVADEAALAAIAAALPREGFICSWADRELCEQRGVAQALLVRDASGNALELVLRPRLLASRFFPPHDSGITGLHSIGLRSMDVARDTRLWTSLLGARVAGRVGDITYLAFDDAHHRIALYPSDRAGLLYIGFGVADFDYLMQHNYRLEAQQTRIVHGPGLEAVSGSSFLRFAGPGALAWSFVHPAAPAAPRAPRQFALAAEAFCAWGSICTELPELNPHHAKRQTP
ncbi:hypothetical protein GCM10010909_18730 [Acidocella aquatica]|uniref:VOC domain-containing protein n=1 Tax=Acidocella aquatica TaxID=1922313 RepID=A0ABQ6A9B0_9PROT|nr:hypothetical protein [Acidocella aquatica]GLR67192.1 hypothetical protein GCM10010909_18730 [Acidocella aquatica]